MGILKSNIGAVVVSLLLCVSQPDVHCQENGDIPQFYDQRSHYSGNPDIWTIVKPLLEQSRSERVKTLCELAADEKFAGLADDFLLTAANDLLEAGKIEEALRLYQEIHDRYPNGILAMELASPVKVSGLEGPGGVCADWLLMWADTLPSFLAKTCINITDSLRRSNALFRSLVEMYPNMTTDYAWLGMAKCYELSGHTSRALEILDYIISSSPAPIDRELRPVLDEDNNAYQMRVRRICASYRALRMAYLEKVRMLRSRGTTGSELRAIRDEMMAKGCPLSYEIVEGLNGGETRNLVAGELSVLETGDHIDAVTSSNKQAAEQDTGTVKRGCQEVQGEKLVEAVSASVPWAPSEARERRPSEEKPDLFAVIGTILAALAIAGAGVTFWLTVIRRRPRP